MQVKIYKRCEIILHSTKEYDNPFSDVDIDAVFTHEDGTEISLPGFWNGENEWKVRFSPDKVGTWKYEISCTDKENASLFSSGVIDAIYAEPSTELEKHGYVRLEKGKRYMVYGDGTPFFYLADTHWQMPDCERLDTCNYPGCTCSNQFKHLSDDRIKKGFTVYQTYFDSAESDGGGNPRLHPWWSEKFTKINPQSFNETMDVMIEYLAENGITVAMGFGVHSSSARGYNFDPEPLLKFTRYCVARYACYPVVWITAQEITINVNNSYEMYKKAGALVEKLDGYHRPNGAHQYVHNADAPIITDLDSQSWHQWWTLQSGHGDVSRLQPRSFYRGYHDLPSCKPYIETECHYEDLYASGHCSTDASRVGAWNAVQSGSAGFTYGVTGIWAMAWDTSPQRGWPGYSPEPWYMGMDKHGSTEMTYLKKFFEYVGWYRLEPSFGYEFASLESRCDVTISHYKKDIIIYYMFGSSNDPGMLIGLKPNTEYQARWFDPIHGKFIDLPSIKTENGSCPVPARPTLRDWALVLNDIDLGEYEAFTYPAIVPTIAPNDAHTGKEIEIKSITATTCADGHPAESMTDGNEDTFWKAFARGTSQTVTVDLGEAHDVGYIQINSNNEAPLFINYRIYISSDGENYEIASERVGNRVAVGGQYPIFFDPLKANCRYIKVVFNSYNGSVQMQINKFGVYEAE